MATTEDILKIKRALQKATDSGNAQVEYSFHYFIIGVRGIYILFHDTVATLGLSSSSPCLHLRIIRDLYISDLGREGHGMC